MIIKKETAPEIGSDETGFPRVVCFINRDLGIEVALDLLSTSDLNLVAIVTHDDCDLGDLPSMLQHPELVMSWSAYLADARNRGLDSCDAGLSVLFGYFIPESVLRFFKRGVVNHHPSLLPLGRGTHPATWAIWENTGYGASVHLVTRDLDEGPLLAQVEIPVRGWDTSADLYARGLAQLWDLYQHHTIPWLRGEDAQFTPQQGKVTSHRSRDLEGLRLFAESATLSSEDHVRLLRALSMGPLGGVSLQQGLDRVTVQISVSPWP